MVTRLDNPTTAAPQALLQTNLLQMKLLRMKRLLVATLLLAGCSAAPQEPPASGLLVVLRSDLNPETELERVLIETVRHGGERRLASLQMGPNDPHMPLSFVVNAQPEDMDQGLTLHVSAFGPGRLDPVVRRSARLQFVSNKTLRLVIDLSRACTTRYAQCESMGDTCDGDGQCIKWDVEASTLPRVRPGEELNALPLFPEPSSNADQPMKPDDRQPATTGGSAASEPNATAKTIRDAGTPAAADTGLPDSDAPDGSVTDGAVVDAEIPVPLQPRAPVPTCAEAQIRCMSGALRTCLDGEYSAEGSIACKHGCYEGAARCNACGPGEKRCAADAIQTCSDGFWKPVQTCNLGCSSLAPHCLECIGPTKRCDENGQLVSCQLNGLWHAATCFERCLARDGQAPLPVDPSDAGDAGNSMEDAAANWDATLGDSGLWDASNRDPAAAACSPCDTSSRRCDGADILSCGIDGYADPLGCHFGCADVSNCREDTRLGQALLMTVLN